MVLRPIFSFSVALWEKAGNWGRVIESGSHRDLLEADGTYANMFRTQAAAYK